MEEKGDGLRLNRFGYFGSGFDYSEDLLMILKRNI